MEVTAEYIAQIQKIVSGRMDLTREVTDAEIKQLIDDVIAEKSKERYLSIHDKVDIRTGVFNAMRGLDVLQPLVDDPSVTEIMINGPDQIFVEQNGRLFRKNVSFGSNEKLENVIQSIVSKVNRTVNESTPTLQGRNTGAAEKRN